ncbi:hypothetical protein [Flavobacterium sp. UBA7663]|uniref:hypothetical protein n=1 Tax=Flavobacterium sp. UBA7663 TaxID=1946557 RepID=UPI0025C046BE|nr:hypothetical protein [Flavobacterium sp. UBA7663]
MLTLKELYNISKNELSDILPKGDNDFRLEQAEYLHNDQVWEVVVSYLTENKNKKTSVITPFAENYQFERVYKKLLIDTTKRVTGFYIYFPK